MHTLLTRRPIAHRSRQHTVWHTAGSGPVSPPAFLLSTVDLFTGNTQFDIHTTDRARRHLAAQRVRLHLRIPGEGVLPEMTKPGREKSRKNMGSVANVCAEAATIPAWWPPRGAC